MSHNELKKRFLLELADTRVTARQARLAIEAVRGRIKARQEKDDLRAVELRLIDPETELMDLGIRANDEPARHDPAAEDEKQIEQPVLH